ncbi:MAG: hypothetical protein QM820_13635 [Minicystis sp.]
MKTTTILGAAAVLVVILGACDTVIGIPDRKVAQHFECNDQKCTCTEGYGDCDGDPSDGCEVDVRTSDDHCGACGNHCNNGTCNMGVCQCHLGFVDCDGDPQNGCEAELATDGRNCGACGHDCLGGACAGSRCQAFELQTFSYPQSISLQGGLLYVAVCSAPQDSPLLRMSVDGGMPAALATNVDCGVYQSTSNGVIYWTNSDAIYASPIVQPSIPMNVVTAAKAKTLRDLATSDDQLYWSIRDDMAMTGSLHRMPLAGGTATVISNKPASGLITDAKNAYWTDATGIHSVPHDGTAITTITGVEKPVSLAVSETTLYVVDTGDTAPGILAVPLAGGTPVMFADGAATFALKIDGGKLYWLDYLDGNIYAQPLAGGPKEVLSAGQGYATNADLAFDEKAIYFLADQAIYKVAR